MHSGTPNMKETRQFSITSPPPHPPPDPLHTTITLTSLNEREKSVRPSYPLLESSWNVMAHGDAREGKWRENWRMEWVSSTLHTTSEHGVSSITTADAHTSAASSGLNWRPRRFKWARPFRRKTKSGFCTCAITFQTQSTNTIKLKTQTI